ncbi:Adp-ribosylation/crystallin j1, partial [Globisporangium splendens]
MIALGGYALLYSSLGFYGNGNAGGAPHSATFSVARTPPSQQLQHQHSTVNMALSVASKQRALAAVVGGFVGDAATMGLHWIYDDAKLAGLVAQAKPNGPEFFNPPSCPFYTYESGALSPYGDEVLPLLQDVATRGAFDPVEFGTVSYLAAKAYKGRLNHIFKELVVKGDAGLKYPNLASESKDSQGATKTPILVAKYGGDTKTLLEKVREATKVHQIGQEADEAAVAVALLLQQVVLGTSIADAIASLVSNEEIGSATRTNIQEVLDDVSAKKFPDAIAAIAEYGKSCALPGVLKGSLFVLLTSSGYVDSVRANMTAGGDNCSRAIIVGAVTAAAAESDPIPAEWKQKTTRYEEIKAFADKL